MIKMFNRLVGKWYLHQKTKTNKRKRIQSLLSNLNKIADVKIIYNKCSICIKKKLIKKTYINKLVINKFLIIKIMTKYI